MISIIVAVGKNREIGYKNKLLWSLPKDMAHFKEITSGHTVIVGDRTFESIGKALPNRNNIVISLNKDYLAPGCVVVHSIEEAVNVAKKYENNGESFVIGGGTIYKLFMPLADKLYLTVVDDAPQADTYFPDYSEFKNVISEEEVEDNGYKLKFLELTR